MTLTTCASDDPAASSTVLSRSSARRTSEATSGWSVRPGASRPDESGHVDEAAGDDSRRVEHLTGPAGVHFRGGVQNPAILLRPHLGGNRQTGDERDQRAGDAESQTPLE